MKTTYIQFEMPTEETNPPKDGWVKKVFITILAGVLTKVIPKANPDFDKEIDDVKFWLLECDEDGIPEREIGLDKDGWVIVKMPFKENYGYWTDNNFILNDFIKRFDATEIDKEDFEMKWKSLI